MAEEIPIHRISPVEPRSAASAASAEAPSVEAVTVSIKRISWGAIAAGVIVALVTQVLLSFLGLAIGISAVDPMADQTRWPDALRTGAGIWWVLSSLVALFAGGWVSSRLGGIPRRLDGGLHGIVTWGVTTLLSIGLITTAVGSLVSGAWGTVRDGLSTSEAMVPGAPVGRPGTGMVDVPGRGGPVAAPTVDAPTVGEEERTVTIERTRRAVAKAAAWSFVALLLGAAAAAAGGVAGSMLRRMPRTASGRA